MLQDSTPHFQGLDSDSTATLRDDLAVCLVSPSRHPAVFNGLNGFNPPAASHSSLLASKSDRWRRRGSRFDPQLMDESG